MILRHKLMDVTRGVPPPPIERIINNEFWPSHLMVCRDCYQVEIHSFNPGEGLGPDETVGNFVVVNWGDVKRMSLCWVEE